MNGYLVTFFTQQDVRHGHLDMHEWLVRTATALGIGGCTVIAATEGVDHRGRRHSVHFFDLADQPVEVQMAMTQDQATRFFDKLREEAVDVFYVKAPVEFGRTGGAGPRP